MRSPPLCTPAGCPPGPVGYPFVTDPGGHTRKLDPSDPPTKDVSLPWFTALWEGNDPPPGVPVAEAVAAEAYPREMDRRLGATPPSATAGWVTVYWGPGSTPKGWSTGPLT